MVRDPSVFVHALALCESDDVGPRTRIWAFAHVLAGARIGADCNVGDHAFVEGGAVVGDSVTIKNGVLLWSGVTVEDEVFLGPGVVFTNDARPRAPYPKGPVGWRATLVRRGATVGANATVLSGLTIGRWAMVGAGSVVTADVPGHAVVVGNPARRTGWACRCGRTLPDGPACSEGPPGRRPTGRRSRVRLVAAVLLVLVLALAVSSLSGLRLWPSFPNPFATRQVDRSQPVLLKAIEDLAVYKAASGNFQVVVDLEEGPRGIPLIIKGQRTLFVAGGSVDAEVDFSTLGEGAIKVSPDGERAEITLPRARLTTARVDPEQSRVFSRERGLLDRLGSVLSDNPTSERELYRLAAAKMQAAAAQSDLVARAEQNTRAMLQSMLRSLGYRDVTVTFRDPPT